MSESNSRSVQWKWLAGILALAVIGMVSAWAADMTSSRTIAQAQISANTAKVAALEAGFASFTQAIVSRLDRIEDKLDQQPRRVKRD